MASQQVKTVAVTQSADVVSELSAADLLRVRVEYNIPIEIELIAPKEEERIFSRSEYRLALHEECLKAGNRLPFSDTIRSFFREFGIAPGQLVPNAWRTLYALDKWGEKNGVWVSGRVIGQVLFLIRAGDFFSFKPVKGIKRVVTGLPSSTKNWKPKFFFARKTGLEKKFEEWRLPAAWLDLADLRPPNIPTRKMEVKALAALRKKLSVGPIEYKEPRPAKKEGEEEEEVEEEEEEEEEEPGSPEVLALTEPVVAAEPLPPMEPTGGLPVAITTTVAREPEAAQRKTERPTKKRTAAEEPRQAKKPKKGKTVPTLKEVLVLADGEEMPAQEAEELATAKVQSLGDEAERKLALAQEKEDMAAALAASLEGGGETTPSAASAAVAAEPAPAEPEMGGGDALDHPDEPQGSTAEALHLLEQGVLPDDVSAADAVAILKAAGRNVSDLLLKIPATAPKKVKGIAILGTEKRVQAEKVVQAEQPGAPAEVEDPAERRKAIAEGKKPAAPKEKKRRPGQPEKSRSPPRIVVARPPRPAPPTKLIGSSPQRASAAPSPLANQAVMEDFSRHFNAMVAELSSGVANFWKEQLDDMVTTAEAERRRFAENIVLGNLLREERAARLDLQDAVQESSQHIATARLAVAGLFESEALDAAAEAGREKFGTAWAEVEKAAEEALKKAAKAETEAEAIQKGIEAAKSEAEAAKLKAKLLGLRALTLHAEVTAASKEALRVSIAADMAESAMEAAKKQKAEARKQIAEAETLKAEASELKSRLAEAEKRAELAEAAAELTRTEARRLRAMAEKAEAEGERRAKEQERMRADLETAKAGLESYRKSSAEAQTELVKLRAERLLSHFGGYQAAIDHLHKTFPDLDLSALERGPK